VLSCLAGMRLQLFQATFGLKLSWSNILKPANITAYSIESDKVKLSHVCMVSVIGVFFHVYLNFSRGWKLDLHFYFMTIRSSVIAESWPTIFLQIICCDFHILGTQKVCCSSGSLDNCLLEDTQIILKTIIY